MLAPRATGKSSLMARTIRRLRADGQAAAVIDFNQIVPRGEQVDSARWHYSIAYRICRELRLKVDLQDWWHDKNLLLSEQRLVEFFEDIVLANTTAPVTVFFDEAERTIDLPFASDLFAAMHSCYMRRISEPEFVRLNFVVLGAASRERLSPDPNASPFVAGRKIRLGDFTLEQCAAFAPGFADAEAAGPLLARIHAWTHGQPYLTQKLARGVARRGSRLAQVDTVLHELFLAPGISKEEPYLSHARGLLTGTAPHRRQAVAMLARLARGQEVIDDPSSVAQRVLDMAGLISSDDNGMLRFRNRIVEQVFGGEWIRSVEPGRWQRPVVIGAAAATLVVLLASWYVRVLPEPYIDTLEQGSDYPRVEQSYRRLARLPGFGPLARRLYGEAMVRRARAAGSIEEIDAAVAALRELPAGAEIAAAELADYWLRRARDHASRGERDAALLHALAAVDGGSSAAAELAVNLIDGDYLSLERTLELPGEPLAVAVDWERDQVVVVDATRRVQRWPLAAAGAPAGPNAAASAGLRTLPERLSALQHVGVTRGTFVDEPGRAEAVELSLTVEHARPSDLLVRLRAPSGLAVDLELPARDGGLERFVIRATEANGLLRLASESITGPWELTVFDRLSGETGRLLNWGVRFAGVPQNFDDAPINGLPLPDPVRIEQVSVELGANGRFAVAIPARADARGAASIWDLTSGARIADIPLSERTESVVPVGDERLLVLGPRRAVLWDLRTGAVVREIAGQDGIAGEAVVSADGRHFALIATDADGASVRLFAAADGSDAGGFRAAAWRSWMLASDAAWIASIDGARRGRVFDPLTGEIRVEFFHDRELVRIIAVDVADRILAVDIDGGIYAWSVADEAITLSPDAGRYLGTTVAADSIAGGSAAAALAWVDASGQIEVASASDGAGFAWLEHGEATGLHSFLDPSAGRLVSVSASRLRSWRLDDGAGNAARFGDVSAVALDPQGGFAVLGYRGGQVHLVSDLPAALGRTRAQGGLPVHRGVVTSLAVNATGELAASGSSDGVVRVWNTRTGDRDLAVLRQPAGPITALAFSADDRWLVSAGPRLVRVFELASGDTASEIEVEGRPVAIAIADDSGMVAVGDSAGNIYLATPDASAGVLTIRVGSPITALDFAGEPAALASGSRNGDLVLWDPFSVSAVASLRFPTPIRWLDLAADGSSIRVHSGNWLHTVDRVASMPAVFESRLLPQSLRRNTAFVATPDGKLLALANAGGGRLEYGELGAATGAAAAIPDRDWPRVLGLALDPATGRLVRSGP